MKVIWIILIVLVGLILFGPIMLGFSKLNKVDPYILEKNPDDSDFDERSFIIVNIFRPLFVPLWLETKLIKKLKK